MRRHPSQRRLKELFLYRDDGHLIWKKNCGGRMRAGTVAGTGTGTRYSRIGIDGFYYKTHRLVYIWHHGYVHNTVDHIDRNKHNNKIENLRSATTRQQSWNAAIKRTNKSGFKGVSWKPSAAAWIASLRINRRTHYLGSFETPALAAQAYDEAASYYFGDFAFLNNGNIP